MLSEMFKMKVVGVKFWVGFFLNGIVFVSCCLCFKLLLFVCFLVFLVLRIMFFFEYVLVMCLRRIMFLFCEWCFGFGFVCLF